MEDKHVTIGTVILILLLLALGIAGIDDQHQRRQEHIFYCEMVQIWNENKYLPRAERPGWPPYKGECDATDNW